MDKKGCLKGGCIGCVALIALPILVGLVIGGLALVLGEPEVDFQDRRLERNVPLADILELPADVEPVEKGLLVTVRRGKPDQEGKGHQRAVLYGKRQELCPVLAMFEWFEAMETAGAFDEGDRLFRSVDRHGRIGESLRPEAVAHIVKGYARLAGLDPAEFGGHSLRAGFVTSAAERGATSERIMDHTGHQSVAMVRVYTRRSDAFADHAGEGLL